MAQICIGGGAGFPSFDTLWVDLRLSFTRPVLTFPPVVLPSFGLPVLPDLLTWSGTPSFSMPEFDLMSWLNELISNFVINLCKIFIDAIDAIAGTIGAIPWPSLPCPSGFDVFDVINGSFPAIAAASGSCLPSLDPLLDILVSIKNGLINAQALIAELFNKIPALILEALGKLLDYLDSIEVSGLPSLPTLPPIPSLADIIAALPTLDLAGFRAYLDSFSFLGFDFSTLLPDPLVNSPIGPLALVEVIKAFLSKLSTLALEFVLDFWNDLVGKAQGLIPTITIPEICFNISFGPPGPPF